MIDIAKFESTTIPQIFVEQVKRSPIRVALQVPVERGLIEISWSKLANDVLAVAHQLGNNLNGERIVQISGNRYEWIVADLAIQIVGAIHVPLHPHLTKSQICKQIDHCNPRIAIVEDQSQFEKLAAATLQSTRFIAFESVESTESLSVMKESECATDVCETVAQIQLLIEKNVTPESLISILYTSGTTGVPKGVMLTQKNVTTNVYQKLACLPLSEKDVRICFLPMSHIFSRTCDLYTWYATGCLSILSRGRDHLLDEFSEHRPTYINAVPYIYEKCYRVLQSSDRLDESDALADLLGGRTQVCNCGGAPIADHVFEYFRKCGINLVTGYGLTETSPVATSSTVDDCRPGAVGKAVPGMELRIAKDGEIAVLGPNVMRGYYRDNEATKSAVRDGWFFTGDIGELDGDGHLTIVGRKKELIVTTGGINVAPIPIEKLIDNIPFVSQSIVIGDQRDYLVALIHVDSSQPESGSAELRTLLEHHLDEALAEVSRYHRVARFCLIGEPFTIENGMLTAKLSLRRDNIHRRYVDEIERLYSSYNSGKTS